MTSREETVLAPTDGSITDENDWWEFSLTEVKVMKPGKKHYANLLDATEQNPVQVIGSLEPLPETHEHLLLKPDNPPKRIIIDEVTHYAYGQTEDKSIELWVAGKAGWYNVISPAKGFQPTYNRMVQAIDLLYFLVDKHQHGKKQLNPSFRNLCEQYTYHSYGSCETREESAEVFALHAAFLLRCMIQGDADVDWMRTSVFVHLRRQFYDDYNRLMEELSPSPDESEAKDEPEVTTPRHEPAAVSKSQTDAIYRLIRDLKKEGHLAKRRLHLDLLTERLADRFSFSNDDARKIIAIRASEVVDLMDDEDDMPGFKWSRYVIHRELTNAASKSAPLPRALLTPLHLADESSDDERFGRTQKSVLRPKVFAVSNKATGKRNRMVPSVQPASEYSDEDEQEDTDEMEDIQNMETPSKVRGHELIRDPLSATKPRARSFLSASSSGAGSSLMKSLFKDKLQSPSISSSTTQHKVSSPEPGPTSTLDTPRGSEEPPTDLPGPWACRMPGCTTVFSMPDGDERRQLIGTHAGEHDWETQMKIELMEQEKRMHSALPVSNLMQYVLDQHVQTMRSAFPEFYTAPKQNGIAEDQDAMGGEESIPETEQPDLEFNEDDQDQDEEDDELEDLANGHS